MSQDTYFQSETVYSALLKAAGSNYDPEDSDMVGVPNAFLRAMYEREALVLADAKSDIEFIRTFIFKCQDELNSITDPKELAQVTKGLQQAAWPKGIFAKKISDPIKYFPFPTAYPNLNALDTFLSASAKTTRIQFTDLSPLKSEFHVQEDRLGKWQYSMYVKEMEKLADSFLAWNLTSIRSSLLVACLKEVIWILWRSPDIEEHESALWVKSASPYFELRKFIQTAEPEETSKVLELGTTK